MTARSFFEELPAEVDEKQLAGLDQSYLFDIEGEGKWLVVIRDGKLAVSEDGDAKADVTIATTSETFDKLASGKQNPATAYMTGKLKVTGDLGAALKLQKLF